MRKLCSEARCQRWPDSQGTAAAVVVLSELRDQSVGHVSEPAFDPRNVVLVTGQLG